MAFASNASAARYLRQPNRGNEDGNGPEEKCCCCFNLQNGVKYIAAVLSVIWIALIYPSVLIDDQSFIVYVILCITNASVFVCIVIAFLNSSKPQSRFLFIPGFTLCLIISLGGFIFATVLSGYALAGKPIKPQVRSS